MSKYYKTINLISWLILGIFVILNLVFIVNSTVNIPFWDEWEIVWDLPNISLAKLFTPHNEHLIVTTKLYIYLQYAMNDLNFKYMAIVNYFFFIGMIFALYLIIKDYTKTIPFTPLLFVMFFSPRFITAFTQPFLISLMLMTTFGLLAIYFGFIRERNNRNIIIMIIFMGLSAISTSYSFSTGVMIAYILKEIIYINKPENKHRMYETLRLIITFLIFTSVVLLPFYIFKNANPRTEFSSMSEFLNHFANSLFLISTLIKSSNLYSSIVYIIFVAIPIVVFIVNGDIFKNKYLQAFYAIIICVIINVAGVSLIRGTYGLMIDPRHYIFAIIATPIIVILFIQLYVRYKNKLTLIATSLFLTIFSVSLILTIISSRGYQFRYSNQRISLQDGSDCVQAYYAGSGNSICETLYPKPLDKHLKKAYDVNLSFVKEYQRQ